ncbi:MAG: hypothetical protein ACUZ8E_10880 [Candidatus Anammoxibacter sp.]
MLRISYKISHSYEGKGNFTLKMCLYSILLIWILGFNNIKPALAENNKLFGIKELFTHIEKSLQAGDEAAFKELWHLEGYNSNPTGRKGYSGAKAFEESRRKGWYIKPDFKTLLKHGLTDVIKSEDVVILPCHIWSFKKHEPIRDIHTAIVREGGHWRILGLSENSKDLVEIVNRFKNPWTPQ